MLNALGFILAFAGVWVFLTTTHRPFAVPLMIVGIVMLYMGGALARDLGQWENTDPAIRHWYQSLTQPDAPTVSCCGEADAYWADEVHVRDGQTYATITDDRDDAPLGRPHVDVGTEILVPPEKLKWEQGGQPIGNPTGHAILYLSTSRHVYCFIQLGGV